MWKAYDNPSLWKAYDQGNAEWKRYVECTEEVDYSYYSFVKWATGASRVDHELRDRSVKTVLTFNCKKTYLLFLIKWC